MLPRSKSWRNISVSVLIPSVREALQNDTTIFVDEEEAIKEA